MVCLCCQHKEMKELKASVNTFKIVHNIDSYSNKKQLNMILNNKELINQNNFLIQQLDTANMILFSHIINDFNNYQNIVR